MDRSSYQQVQLDSEEASFGNTNTWKILRRQVFVSSAVWSSFFTLGLLFGTPTVYIAQTRKEANSTEALNDEMASWISSAHTYSAIPCFFITAAFSRYYGRKKTFLFACFLSVIGFITIYLSTSVTEMLLSECILGTLLANDFITCAMVLTEYTSTRYRGFFLTIKSATFAWGVLVANAIGIFIHWRNIALLGSACLAYSFVVGLLWPESPYWLASNKDYIACSESHCWLKGNNEESMRELKGLIRAHQDLNQVKKESAHQSKGIKLVKMLFSKVFYRPFIYSVLMSSLYQFSGKMACNVYAIQIIKGIVDNETTANTGTLAIDAVCVLSMYLSSTIIKLYKRKQVLIITTFIGVSFLFTISGYLYLVKWKWIDENKFIFLFFLTMYMLAISCGPVTLAPTITAELCPLRYRGIYMLLSGLAGNIIMATMVKSTPYLFSLMGSHGTFLFYGISSFFLITLVYCVVPETKDTTIVEMNNIISN